jgi:hypothetical protein
MCQRRNTGSAIPHHLRLRLLTLTVAKKQMSNGHLKRFTRCQQLGDENGSRKFLDRLLSRLVAREESTITHHSPSTCFTRRSRSYKLNGLMKQGKCPRPFSSSKSGCPVMRITEVDACEDSKRRTTSNALSRGITTSQISRSKVRLSNKFNAVSPSSASSTS